MSMRMFDDRTYIIDRDDPIGEELTLINAIGTNKHKNPMIAKIAEYVAPGLEGLKVGLSVWRAAFNLMTWRDPFLTSLFFFGILSVLCVLLIFPWRLFFFAAGLGAVGPQVRTRFDASSVVSHLSLSHRITPCDWREFSTRRRRRRRK